jgi:hypothetical protein
MPGRIEPIFISKDAFKRWSGERYELDLYVWLQINEEYSFYEATFIKNTRTTHENLLDSIIADLSTPPLLGQNAVVLLG